MKTETCKLYSGVFWIFLPNIIKIDLYHFELYRFKVGPFFMRHSVICAVIFFCQFRTCAAILFNELCLCVCDRMVGGPATAAHQSAESDGDSEPAAAARHVAELHDWGRWVLSAFIFHRCDTRCCIDLHFLHKSSVWVDKWGIIGLSLSCCCEDPFAYLISGLQGADMGPTHCYACDG